MSVWGMIGYLDLVSDSKSEYFEFNDVVESLSIIPGGLFEIASSFWSLSKGLNYTHFAPYTALNRDRSHVLNRLTDQTLPVSFNSIGHERFATRPRSLAFDNLALSSHCAKRLTIAARNRRCPPSPCLTRMRRNAHLQ